MEHTLIPSFNMRNVFLPLFLAETAIDLDNCNFGLEKDADYLATLLDGVTRGKDFRQVPMDMRFAFLFSISGRDRIYPHWDGKNMQDVLNETQGVARDLRDYRNLSTGRRKEIIDFCIRLGKEVGYVQDGVIH